MATSILPGTSPFIMAIFGATGDLAQNKLIPALFSLYKNKSLPEDFFIIGFSRREFTKEAFHDYFQEQKNNKAWKEFSSHLLYQSGSFEDEKGYKELDKKLLQIDKQIGACVTRFFYLATPPDHYQTILNNLVSTKLSEGCGHPSASSGQANSWTRIIIEKPFGKDLETARNLDKKLAEIFEEKQIFRVDHYLGKETVQNMLAFRFANGIFEPVWNKNLIDHVQITWAEESGIGKRGKFFDGVGILRDVFQNHLMQLIAAVAMEQPKSFTKEDLRGARANVIGAITYANEEKPIVKGQYKGYRSEKDVSPDSKTETFIATKLFINTPKLEGVPFYVRAGKKMKKNLVEISVVFIQTCHILFKEYGCPEIGNVLTFRIQPNEGIDLRFIAKTPGSKLSLQPVNMKFGYKDDFGTSGLEAYEKVLLDIFAGDQMLFNRSDELESSWELITGILDKWKQEKDGIQVYSQGAWGPGEANELIEKDGRKWLV
ncbi:MAG: glucose-6-phosphate dehydrogenase [Patescibacteria group bacterium]|nr:glucose-6-phosphate dehydrogenase [Patescibacteria group bacterium]